METAEYEEWKRQRDAELQERKEAEKEKLNAHVMGWVVPCGRNFFGPPPCSAEDLYYLRKREGVGAIVSLKPETGRTTKKNGYDTSVWYRELLADAEGNESEKLRVFVAPFATKNLPSLKDAEIVEAYVKLAKKLHTEIRPKMPNTPLYIHHTDGFSHEGYVAMALWRLEAGLNIKDIPSDPVAWLKSNGHDQVCKMTVEKETLQAVWARVKTISTGIGAMFAAQRVRQKGKEPAQKKRKKDDE